MKKFAVMLFFLVGAQSALSETLYSDIAPFTLYSEEQEVFLINLSDAIATDLSTGQITTDPVYRVRNGYYPALQGYLVFPTTGNYFVYFSTAGMANITESFNVLIDMKNGDTLWPDYTMNVLPFTSLSQLLYVPTFDSQTYGGIANLLISSYDRETGAKVTRDDLLYLYPVNSGYYAPSKGVVTPHVSGFPDVVTYTANPGASGWDRILIFTRNEAGKVGYNFFYIYIP